MTPEQNGKMLRERSANNWALQYSAYHPSADTEGFGIEDLAAAYMAGADQARTMWKAWKSERDLRTGTVNLDHLAQGRYLDSIQKLEPGSRTLVWLSKQPTRDTGEYLVDIDGESPRPTWKEVA